MRSMVLTIVACLACSVASEARAESIHVQICRKLGVGHSSGYHAETCCTGCAPYSNGIRRPCYTPVFVGYGGCGPQGCGPHATGEYIVPPQPARATQIYDQQMSWGHSLEVVSP